MGLGDERKQERDRERLNEYQRRYYERNKERFAERAREYQKRNRERVKERVREYREQNKERVREWNRKYYEQNKKRIRGQSKKRYHQKKYGVQQTNAIVPVTPWDDGVDEAEDNPLPLVRCGKCFRLVQGPCDRAKCGFRPKGF